MQCIRQGWGEWCLLMRSIGFGNGEWGRAKPLPSPCEQGNGEELNRSLLPASCEQRKPKIMNSNDDKSSRIQAESLAGGSPN